MIRARVPEKGQLKALQGVQEETGGAWQLPLHPRPAEAEQDRMIELNWVEGKSFEEEVGE